MRQLGAFALALVVALVVAASAHAATPVGGLTELVNTWTAGPNLVKDPGFESGGDAWKLRPSAKHWAVESGGHAGAASLRLTDAEHAEYTALAEQTVTLEPGFYTLEGWARGEGLGASSQHKGARFCLDGRPRINWWMCTDVVRGTTGWTLLRQASMPVREAGTYRVTAEAYARPEGRAWFDDVRLTALTPPLLAAYLLSPNFRGMLFEDRPQLIRVSLYTTTRDARTRGARMRLSLLDETTGRTVRQRDVPASMDPVDVELDASGVGGATMLVRPELLDGNGKVLFRHPDYRVVKVSAKERKKLDVWYDENNVTYFDGKPAFVLGLYNTTGYSYDRQAYARGENGWGDDRIAEAPINMLINYWLGITPISALGAYMDDLHAHGIHYLHTVNFYHQDDSQYGKIPYPAAKRGDEELNRWIARELGGHRGLAGFYTADERRADFVPKAFRQRRALAENAPGSVTYAVLGDGWEEQAPLWRDAVDVIGLDPYPIRARSDNNLAMVGEWTRLGRDAVMASRPVWMVLQYFPLTGQGGWPSFDDLRTMSWMAIIDGAKGLFYWSFGEKGLAWIKDEKEKQAKWAELVRITKEIKALEPVLLAPDARVVTAETSRGAIRTLAKQVPDGARYLFAYNSSRTPAAVTWTLAAPASETIDIASGKPGPRVENNALTDRFAGFEIKLYKLR